MLLNIQILSFCYGLLLLNSLPLKEHKCIHNKLNYTLKKGRITQQYNPHSASTINEELKRRALGKSSFVPFNMVYNFKFWSGANENEDKYFKENILPFARDYIRELLRTYSSSSSYRFKLSSINTKCTKEIEIPTDILQAGLKEEDYLIFMTCKYEPKESFRAWAIPCYVNPDRNYKPKIGRMHINLYHFPLIKGKTDFHHDALTIVHEIFHLIGFSNTFFRFYVDGNGNNLNVKNVYKNFSRIDNVKVKGLILPQVLAVAKSFFNCPNLSYVPTEDDQGNIGSHWERVIFKDEIMSPVPAFGAKISNFSLSVLNSTGWYLVNEGMDQNLYFGLNKGCDFFSRACNATNKFNEFFYNTNKRDTCRYDGLAPGIVYTDNYLENCKIAISYLNNCLNKLHSHKNVHETYENFGSHNSICFESTLTIYNPKNNFKPTRCYSAYCSGNDLYIVVGNGSIICRSGDEGKVLTVKSNSVKGSIICPNNALYCKVLNDRCGNNNCNNEGFCNRKKICSNINSKIDYVKLLADAKFAVIRTFSCCIFLIFIGFACFFL